jgi:hypothetical protein
MKERKNTLLGFVLPKFSDLIWIVAFIGALVRGRKMMNLDGDLGRHLTLGKYMLENLTIPRFDLFSHTMLGETVTPHEWLSQVLFASVYRLADFKGVILLCGVVIATTFWLVYRRTRKTTQSLFIALLVTFLAMTTSALHWLSRPHIYTFLFLALWVDVLERMLAGKVKQWWLMPLLMVFWANLHGAFIAGFMTWFLYGFGILMDQLWQKRPLKDGLPEKFWLSYLLGGGASLLASFINPSGLGIWGTSVGYLGERFLVDMTIEYQSPNFHAYQTWPFLLFIILLVIALGVNRKDLKFRTMIPATAWLAMSLYSARHIPLFAIVTAPLLASELDTIFLFLSSQFKWVDFLKRADDRYLGMDRKVRGGVWPVVLFGLAALGLALGLKYDYQQLGYAYDPEKFPVEAVTWMAENPQEGNMFNYFIWGGYMLYEEWPEDLVFIDGQTDFYGEDLTRQYLEVMSGDEGWEEIFEEYDLAWAILPVDEISVHLIQVDLGWEEVYRDETAVILHR